MSDYKQAEREHYNSRYDDEGSGPPFCKSKSIFGESADKINENAVKYFYNIVSQVQAEIDYGRLLDYGCGAGEKSVQAIKDNWILSGIDISEKSIAYAKKKFGNLANVSFQVMDCEQTKFPDNTFDIIFNFGTSSSINIKKAVPEIIRILKPDGALICIETLGHNPIINFKRQINVLLGKRTRWASSHIMKMHNWKFIEEQFISTKIKHFNLLTVFYSPVIKIFPTSISNKIIKFLWSVDDIILEYPFIKMYAFKTVACFRFKKEL